jgi:hypothetical protein
MRCDRETALHKCPAQSALRCVRRPRRQAKLSAPQQPDTRQQSKTVTCPAKKVVLASGNSFAVSHPFQK